MLPFEWKQRKTAGLESKSLDQRERRCKRFVQLYSLYVLKLAGELTSSILSKHYSLKFEQKEKKRAYQIGITNHK